MKKHLLFSALLLLCAGLFAQTPRMCLYEEFTGETCPPCASTNPGLNILLASTTNAPKVIALKWQVPIPSAPSNTWSLYQTNKAEINWRYSAYGYGINSAPSGRMDGQNVTVFGASSDHPANLSNAIIATAQSFTSPFSVSMNRAWNSSCTAVNVTVNIQASANFTATGNLIFRLCMVERMINFAIQPGTNGEKDFEDVVIKSFPSIQAGTSMVKNWITGQTQTIVITCPIPTYVRKKSEIAMVGFIQDDGNKKIAQAVRADKQAVPSDALAALGASVNLTCSSQINPTITIRNDGPNAITTATINPFNDGVAATPFVWTGNLASGASTTIVLSNINAASTAGSHLFSFNVDLNVPQYNLTTNINSTNYIVASSYQGAAVSEGFTATAFPPTNWGVMNPDGGTASWSRNTATGAYNTSNESVKYDFYNNNNIGDMDELYLPPMNLSGSAGDPVLTFDYAYAMRNLNSNDQLDFFASNDCGATWTNFYSKSGSALTTVATPFASAFTPDPLDITQWRTETVVLTGFNTPNVMSKFIVTNTKGNNLYLDNINLAQSVSGISKTNLNRASFVLYPNPASNNVVLRVDANAGEVKVNITNALGDLIYSKNLSSDSHTLSIDTKDFASGLYLVNVESAKVNSTQKLVITK